MILMTFVQTADLAIKVPLKWPYEVKSIANTFSIFNLNIEMAKVRANLVHSNSRLTGVVCFVI